MPYRLAAVLLLWALLLACIPPADEEEESAVVVAELTDSLVQRVYELQNERAEDSLLAYLAHPEARLRYLAAQGLASFPALSAGAVDSLGATLRDPNAAVRTQAAYALGQTGRPEAAAWLTASFDRTGKYPTFNAAVLEAAGRTGDSTTVNLLTGITTYTMRDTALMAGRAWGLYYAGLNGNRSPASDAVMVNTLLDRTAPAAVRHPAAHYLYRIEFPVDTAAERKLHEQLRREKDPVVSMGIIRTLGRSGLLPARVSLLRYFETSADWRTRVEVLRAFEGFEYAAVRESVIEALRDRHPLVARTAAEYLIRHGVTPDAPLYLQLAESGLPHQLYPLLYRAANRHLSPFLTDYRDRIAEGLRRAYQTEADPYVKADILRALGEFPWLYREIYNHYVGSESPVLRTAAAETLQAIVEREDFDQFFRWSSRRVRLEIAEQLRRIIEAGEAGPAYHAGQALTNRADTYRSAYADFGWLDTALDDLELPRQIETYRAVLGARNALLQSEVPEPALASGKAHPIDWSLVTTATPPVVRIETAEGAIRLRLWPAAAPATVSSFLRLVREGYYDGKVFHRVVPNFVAQGGGPRGDGFGSEDFIVRTETPMLHWDRAGLVGMASAGKDTEGVQFFITHRPTPHLDGRFTIFAEVIEGQSVVDRLVPGSRITRITVP
ncbi:cyclophilin family peptidyl-prolyl cis-trans isomerase/HEAT repeat protein [Lewinella marina]|nr:peptidylprolyl isomerase [Neolewinella marina]NJB84728.1 cyclophilin family peptidyl-prolyl cis-trans isomerase/HEAT repeat protein [Neolewinella marina]